MVVEIVDTQARIEAFLPELDLMIGEGLVTLEKVQVITYRHHQDDQDRITPEPRDPGPSDSPPR
jgi:hypothetical protein